MSISPSSASAASASNALSEISGKIDVEKPLDKLSEAELHKHIWFLNKAIDSVLPQIQQQSLQLTSAVKAVQVAAKPFSEMVIKAHERKIKSISKETVVPLEGELAEDYMHFQQARDVRRSVLFVAYKSFDLLKKIKSQDHLGLSSELKILTLALEKTQKITSIFLILHPYSAIESYVKKINDLVQEMKAKSKEILLCLTTPQKFPNNKFIDLHGCVYKMLNDATHLSALHGYLLTDVQWESKIRDNTSERQIYKAHLEQALINLREASRGCSNALDQLDLHNQKEEVNKKMIKMVKSLGQAQVDLDKHFRAVGDWAYTHPNSLVEYSKLAAQFSIIKSFILNLASMKADKNAYEDVLRSYGQNISPQLQSSWENLVLSFQKCDVIIYALTPVWESAQLYREYVDNCNKVVEEGIALIVPFFKTYKRFSSPSSKKEEEIEREGNNEHFKKLFTDCLLKLQSLFPALKYELKQIETKKESRAKIEAIQEAYASRLNTMTEAAFNLLTNKYDFIEKIIAIEKTIFTIEQHIHEQTKELQLLNDDYVKLLLKRAAPKTLSLLTTKKTLVHQKIKSLRNQFQIQKENLKKLKAELEATGFSKEVQSNYNQGFEILQQSFETTEKVFENASKIWELLQASSFAYRLQRDCYIPTKKDFLNILNRVEVFSLETDFDTTLLSDANETKAQLIQRCSNEIETLSVKIKQVHFLRAQFELLQEEVDEDQKHRNLFRNGLETAKKLATANPDSNSQTVVCELSKQWNLFQLNHTFENEKYEMIMSYLELIEGLYHYALEYQQLKKHELNGSLSVEIKKGALARFNKLSAQFSQVKWNSSEPKFKENWVGYRFSVAYDRLDEILSQDPKDLKPKLARKLNLNDFDSTSNEANKKTYASHQSILHSLRSELRRCLKSTWENSYDLREEMHRYLVNFK